MREFLTILLLIFCFIATPVFGLTALDVGGSTDDNPPYNYYEEVVQHAAAMQRSAGYRPASHLQPEINTVLDGLPQENLYFFHGHCGPGVMGIKENDKDPSPRYIYADNHPKQQLKGLDLSKTLFAFFDCCDSANTDSTNGNLRTTTFVDGAQCVFGFKGKIATKEPTIVYGRTFWAEAKRGSSWNGARDKALAALDDNPSTKKLCEDTYDKHCGYSTLEPVSRNGKCNAVMMPRSEIDGMIQPLVFESTDITLDQAQALIREFTGNPNLNATYEKPFYNISPNIYKFTAGDACFSINSAKRRVEIANFGSSELLIPKSGEKEVGVDEAYGIAERFAQRQYPQLWDTTDKTGVRVDRKDTQDHGQGGYENVIGWAEEYYYPDKNTPGYLTITGPKFIEISVSPDGKIYFYREDLTPRDESVSLRPDLTEERAWDLAKKYFAEENVDMTDADKNYSRLRLIDRHTPPDYTMEKQYLVWYFRATNSRGYGGEIAVDAHDGRVVSCVSYV